MRLWALNQLAQADEMVKRAAVQTLAQNPEFSPEVAPPFLLVRAMSAHFKSY